MGAQGRLKAVGDEEEDGAGQTGRTPAALVKFLSTDLSKKEWPTSKLKLAKDQTTLLCGRSQDQGSPVLHFCHPWGVKG